MSSSVTGADGAVTGSFAGSCCAAVVDDPFLPRPWPRRRTGVFLFALSVVTFAT
jgi:hypothetical protein